VNKENLLEVMHFILDHRVGGPHIYVDTLRRSMAREVNGHLVTAGYGDLTDIELVNLRKFWRKLYPIEVLVNTFVIFFRFGILRRSDLFHVHGAANLAPLIAAFLCRMPIVWHFHETTATHARLARLGLWFTKRCPHRLLTVARGSDSLLISSNGLSAQADLVPGLVDTDYWKADNDKYVNRTIGSSFRLITVANLNPLKGIDVLLDALPMVGHPIELEIIGSSLQTQLRFTELLDRKVDEMAMNYNYLKVKFVGPQKPDAIRLALSNADAFVLPSRSEACPIALLEAMSMGLPCVATAVGAVREMLPSESHTFICPPEHPQALANNLRLLIDTPVFKRQQIGALNRQAVLFQFSPERIAALVINCYSAVLDRQCDKTKR
jgi:glycosyltransferase involved in cell wall biosynthesis